MTIKIPPKKKGKLEVIQGKITELKKKDKRSYGDDGGIEADCFLIEKAVNGYILKLLALTSEEEMVMETTFVFNNKEDLIEMLNEYI